VESLKDEIDDIGELLMFFQDIFELRIPPLSKALVNSLMCYSYFPSIHGSLVPGTTVPEINSYPAAIFFLS
jgi:hypothetical protein